MFSQACVKNSVHRGCTFPRQTPPQADTPISYPEAHPPGPETATAVDGRHPTRMHPCVFPLTVRGCGGVRDGRRRFLASSPPSRIPEGDLHRCHVLLHVPDWSSDDHAGT